MSTMHILLRERRQIENEMIFRRKNESVGIGLDELNALHVEDGNPQLASSADIVLEFKCECSDKACSERITLKLSGYHKLHLNRDTFIIKPEHQVESIEEVVQKKATYYVVKKHENITEPGKLLNVTSPLS